MEKIDNIIANINSIKKNIANISINQDEVNIVLATKTVSREILLELVKYDNFVFGENIVQEFRGKYFEDRNATWHFIGQLQSNKVKYIIDKVDLIHSLDRLSLAEEINKQAGKINKKMDVLIEINLAEETNKGGVSVNDAEEFINQLEQYDNIRVCGLMSVMPNVCEEKLEKYYLQLNTLYDRIKYNKPSYFRYLSVGMSGDYIIALKHGSNMIRPGRIIFGERNGGAL